MAEVLKLFFFDDRERVCPPKDESAGQSNDDEKSSVDSLSTTLQSPTKTQNADGALENPTGDQQNEHSPAANHSARSFTKSASISASQCVVVGGTDTEVIYLLIRSFIKMLPLLFLVVAKR